MKITIVPYMYRDASNYKTFGDIRLVGAITDEQRVELKASLGVDDRFIPEQLGLDHLGWIEDDWASFPDSSDHVWHELFVDEIRFEEIPDFTRGPYTPESVDEFVKRFTDVGPEGWDDTSRYSLDE